MRFTKLKRPRQVLSFQVKYIILLPKTIYLCNKAWWGLLKKKNFKHVRSDIITKWLSMRNIYLSITTDFHLITEHPSSEWGIIWMNFSIIHHMSVASFLLKKISVSILNMNWESVASLSWFSPLLKKKFIISYLEQNR